MSGRDYDKVNPELDLVLERVIDVPPELVFEAWTTPKHLKEFFCPKPWMTTQIEIDLRPGGKFYSVMRSPEGQEFPNTGCFLEIVENRKLVWTNALEPGFRPVLQTPENLAGVIFTAVLDIEPHEIGTKYTATAIHVDPKSRQTHADMGFHDGWSTVVDQLVAYMKSL